MVIAFFLVPVLVSVKTGSIYLRPWAHMVVDLWVEIALHDFFLIATIVCACPAAWGIGNLHQAAAVEEEPCPSAVGSMSPGAVELVEEEAFDRLGRLISVEATVFNSELLCHHVGQFFHVIRHFCKSPDNRLEYPAALAVEVELRFKTIARVASPCIKRFGPKVVVFVDLSSVHWPLRWDCQCDRWSKRQKVKGS